MMDRNIRTFITKILIAAAVLVVLAWIVFTYLIPGQYLPVLPWMLLFFTVVAVSTHAWQVNLAKKKLGLFTRYSMLISMLRLMMYSIFAFVYLAIDQSNAAVFVVSLVVVYAIYTMLEVSDLAAVVKRK
ncbi:MAG: hypothetical protein ACOC10_07855 [Bacteroidota bacterium]